MTEQVIDRDIAQEAQKDPVINMLLGTTMLTQLCSWTPETIKNTEYFFKVLDYNLLLEEYTFADSIGKESFELITLAMFALNWDDEIPILEGVSSIGEFFNHAAAEHTPETPIDLKTPEYAEMLDFMNQDITQESSWTHYGDLHKLMKKLFRYKNSPTTVKRVCEQLVTWGWFKKSPTSKGRFALDRSRYLLALLNPLDFSSLTETPAPDEFTSEPQVVTEQETA